MTRIFTHHSARGNRLNNGWVSVPPCFSTTDSDVSSVVDASGISADAHKIQADILSMNERTPTASLRR
jgi:hypothetical protein